MIWLCLRRGPHLALCIDYELCVLEVSPGVVCTYHGVTRKKWGPIYVTQSHWHIAVSRNWKVHLRSSQQQRMLRILRSRNPMKWDDRFTSCNLSDIQKLSENSQSVVPTKKDYAIATVKEVLTLSQSASAVIPVPFLQEAIGIALVIIQVCEVRWIPPLKFAGPLIKFLIRKHRMWNKKSKNCKLGSAISWSLSWTT